METASLSWGDWTWEPTVIVGLLVLCAVYALAWRRGPLRAGDDVSPWLPGPSWRVVMFGAGIATMVLALLSPIDKGGDEYLFLIHMVQHLLLMMIAPPLVLLGIAGFTPPAPDRYAGVRRLWTAITRPWPAVLIFNAILLVWHIPQLYDTTLTVEPVHVLEHLTFIFAGFVLWWPVVDPIRNEGAHRVTALQKVAMLTISGVPSTILGLIFSLGSHAFYDFYVRAPRLWGLSPVADQQIAGAFMFGLGNVIFFVAISIVFLRMFETDPEQDEHQASLEGV